MIQVKYFGSSIDYNEVKEKIKDEILSNFPSRSEQILLHINGKDKIVSKGEFLANLILLRMFVETIDVEETDFFNSPDITQKSLEKYFNFLIERFHETISYDEIRRRLADTICEISEISGDLNVAAGHTISYLDFLKVSEEDKELGEELFNPKIETGQYSYVEKQFKDHGDKLIQYYKKNKDREMHPYIISGTGINTKQLTQCVGFVGLKPNLNGDVIPVIVKDNFLNGLNTLENYYINSVGTRLALLTNKVMTKKSGYLTRKLYLSNIDHYHDNDFIDCGTKHFINYSINNKEKLSAINGRNYYELDESGNKISELKIIDASKDQHLIGKTIGLRSPVTCAGGKRVCKTCYGNALSEINKDVNTGLVAVLKITEPLTQKLLSAKHLLTTNSEEVNWGEEFQTYFSVNMDTIYFADDIDVSITFQKPKEFNEDLEMYSIEEFSIQESGKKILDYKSPVKLYVNLEFLSTEEDEITINSSSLRGDEFIFKFEPQNNAITKSLQQILDLVDSNEKLGITDYHTFVNKFVELLIENEMGYIKAVHAEMVSTVLMRRTSDLQMIDFSKDEIEPYEILRVSKVDLLSPLAVSLSFERIPEQLLDLRTYEKTEGSLMDALFR